MAKELTNIVDTLAKELEKQEKQNPNIQAINEAIKRAKKIREQLISNGREMNSYNEAVERIQKLQQAFNTQLSYPFNTEDAQNAVIDAKINASENTYYINYRKNKMEDDIALIRKLNQRIEKLGIEGYSAIMDLREKITGQTIIYAVQGFKNKNSIYHEYIEENEFLTLLKSKVQYTDFMQLRKISPEYKNAYLQIDFQSIQKKYKTIQSRDKLYEMISKYVSEKSGKKLKPSKAWEAYTEAKMLIGKQPDDISEDELKSFLGKWLMMQSATYERRMPKGKTAKSSLSSLTFYQGGDTSTYSKYVAIQNKSSNVFEAGINIQTIYNGLNYIYETFPNNGEIDIEAVKQLFTASNLSDMPNNIVTEAFNVANEYAQEQITKNIQALNNIRR